MNKDVTDLQMRLRKLRAMISDDAQRLVSQSHSKPSRARPADPPSLPCRFAYPPGLRNTIIARPRRLTVNPAIPAPSPNRPDTKAQPSDSTTSHAAQMVAQINNRLLARGITLTSDVALEVHQVVRKSLDKWAESK